MISQIATKDGKYDLSKLPDALASSERVAKDPQKYVAEIAGPPHNVHVLAELLNRQRHRGLLCCCCANLKASAQSLHPAVRPRHDATLVRGQNCTSICPLALLKSSSRPSCQRAYNATCRAA